MSNALCLERNTRSGGGRGSRVDWQQKKVEKRPKVRQVMKGWICLAKSVNLIPHSRGSVM